MNHILYHGNCMDGQSAAWAAQLKLRDAHLIKGTYGMPTPDIPIGDTLYIVDFSLKAPQLEAIAMDGEDVGTRIVLLDHHKTCIEDQAIQDLIIGGVITGTLDTNKAGCWLAWDYFHPGEAMPKVLYYIGLRDLWRHKGSKDEARAEAIHMYMGCMPFDMHVYSDIMLHTDIGRVLDKGMAMRTWHQFSCKGIVEQSWTEVDDAGLTRAVVSCSPHFASEVCHGMLDRYSEVDYAAVFTGGRRSTYWSLRSEDDRADVSAIAKAHGGGGHRNAAGYKEANVQVRQMRDGNGHPQAGKDGDEGAAGVPPLLRGDDTTDGADQ